MRVQRMLELAWSVDLPEEIRHRMMLNQLCVEFDQPRMAVGDRAEPNFEQCVQWCEHNLRTVFCAFKISVNHTVFRFYSTCDLELFELWLTKHSA